MGIWKLNPHEISQVKYTPKELSDFWKSYFASLSISLNKLFFKYTHEHITVRFIHREVVRSTDYFENVHHNSIVQPFKVYPHGDLGFLFLPDDLSNFLLNSILGGKESHLDLSHVITEVDQNLLENILHDMMTILIKQFKDDHRNMEFELTDHGQFFLYANSLNSTQLLSVQQFMVMTNKNSFVFDIAFTNRVLEQFVIL